ncbi:hypothetical protein KKG71_04705 [Patescibacteria group bacterium]|nr:hypothetical protein [Patescibacteria group bacterium]
MSLLVLAEKYSAENYFDIFWLHQTILVSPEGSSGPHEVEVIVNGIVKPSARNQSLTFCHLGEIYGLENQSGKWLDAWENPSRDWFVSKVLNNPVVSENERIMKCSEDRGKFKFRTFLLNTFSIDATTFVSTSGNLSKPSNLSNISVCCNEEDKEIPNINHEPSLETSCPIYSKFSINFEEESTQLFRIRFKTRYYKPLQSQIVITVGGVEKYTKDIKRFCNNSTRCKELKDAIDNYNLKPQPPIEVVIIGHPMMTLNFESKVLVDFDVETKDTPINSAACLSRAAMFIMDRPGSIIKATSTIPEHFSLISPTYQAFQKDFNDELRRYDSKKGR